MQAVQSRGFSGDFLGAGLIGGSGRYWGAIGTFGARMEGILGGIVPTSDSGGDFVPDFQEPQSEGISEGIFPNPADEIHFLTG